METESQMESPVMPTVAPMSPAPSLEQLREQWAAFSNHTQQAIEHIAKVSVRGLDAWSNDGAVRVFLTVTENGVTRPKTLPEIAAPYRP